MALAAATKTAGQAHSAMAATHLRACIASAEEKSVECIDCRLGAICAKTIREDGLRRLAISVISIVPMFGDTTSAGVARCWCLPRGSV